VITAFTLAHSITLLASVLEVISLPSDWIEVTIALSIMLSACLNLQKRIRISHWKLALVFGLIHGMGFANGLRELGLSPHYFIETVLAFNIGVELGQIAAVAAVGIPVIWLAKETSTQTAHHDLWIAGCFAGVVYLVGAKVDGLKGFSAHTPVRWSKRSMHMHQLRGQRHQTDACQ